MCTHRLVSSRFRAELHELCCGAERQLDRARSKQASPKCCCCHISCSSCHRQSHRQAECFSGSWREPTSDSSRWYDWWKQATFQAECSNDVICPAISQ